jgi:hypothetical protein
MGDPFSILLVSLLTQGVQMVLQSLMVISRNQFRFLRVTSVFYPITSLHLFETSSSSFTSFHCSLSSMFYLSVTCWVFTSTPGTKKGQSRAKRVHDWNRWPLSHNNKKNPWLLGEMFERPGCAWWGNVCCCLFGRIWSLAIRVGFSNVGGWGPWGTGIVWVQKRYLYCHPHLDTSFSRT